MCGDSGGISYACCDNHLMVSTQGEASKRAIMLGPGRTETRSTGVQRAVCGRRCMGAEMGCGRGARQAFTTWAGSLGVQ